MKPAHFASNFHKPHVISTTMCRIGNKYVQVSILHIAKQNQMHYKTIDYFDQLVERYTVGRRCYRSWMYIFNWLKSATIVNSYILHGMSSTMARKKTYVQIDFRHELAVGLINKYNGGKLVHSLNHGTLVLVLLKQL